MNLRASGYVIVIQIIRVIFKQNTLEETPLQRILSCFIIAVLIVTMTACAASLKTQDGDLTEADLPDNAADIVEANPNLNTLSPQDIMGEINHVPAYGDILLDWFFYIPSSYNGGSVLDLLVTGINGDAIGDYDMTVSVTQEIMSGQIDIAEEHGYILVSIAIPRGDNGLDPGKLDRRMYYNADEYSSEYLRPEDQLVAVYDLLTSYLVTHDIRVRSGLFLEGFSTGGMFTQRFTLVYPEYVRAIATGSCCFFTLPLENIDSTELHWPIGIADYEFMFDKTFDVETYRQVPQLAYIGQGDNGGRFEGLENDPFYYSSDEVNFVYDYFSDIDPLRIEKQVEYLNDTAFDSISYYTYPSEGHEKVDNQVIVDFFEQYR